MKLSPDKLPAALAKGLAPIYLLHGDEPLQQMELADQIRAHAREQGYTERRVLVPLDDADWLAVREAADSLSLFAERRLLDLRLSGGKPGRRGAEVLRDYTGRAVDDVVLLIVSGRLDRSAAGSAWFKALDANGVTVAVKPIPAAQLPRWLEARLLRHGLTASQAALALIAERVEGNLLAANQEVERLALLYPAGQLDVDEVLGAVANCARYAVGDFVQAALNGSPLRVLRVLRGLREEGAPPTLILWTLTQEIRAATQAAEAHAEGVSLDRALKAAGVWPSRAGPLKVAIARHSVPGWLGMLAAASRLDRLVKGRETGDVWDAIESLGLALAGAPLALTDSSPV